jgi:hypothetical protein
MIRRLFPLLLLLLSCLSARAQFLGIGRPRAKGGEAPPKAVLIELLTRAGQRDYLVEHRPELLAQFNSDVDAVMKRTVLDWSTYFKFCPVYFFVDSQAKQIMAGEFAGVLLDSSMNPVAQPIIQNGERNIYIAYYGTPMPQPDTVRPNSPSTSAGQYMEHDGDDATSLLHDRLLVNDADFRLLSERKPRTNFVRGSRPDWMGTADYRAYYRSIVYNAKRWYIDYQPIAYNYDLTLQKYFRIKKASFWEAPNKK